MTSLSGPQSQATHQRHEDDETFEMILSPATKSSTPKNPKENQEVPSSNRIKSIDKNSSASNARSIARIAIAVTIGAATGLFVGGVVSRDAIQELRSEFKRDLDSLRAEVKHELGVHSIATAAAVQTAANARVTEFQHQNIESLGNLEITQEEVGSYTMKDRHGSSLADCKPCNNLLDNESHLREGRMQLSDIFPNEWTDTIRGWLHSAKITARAAYDWIQQKIVRLRNLRPDDIVTVVLDWIQNTNLLPAIDLDSLALRDPFEDGIFFSALLRLFLLLLVTYCVAYDWVRDRFIDFYRGPGGVSKTHDDSSNPARDDKISSIPEERIPDLVERKEDVIMEQVFYDSVAAAMKLPGLPRGHTSSKQNGSSYRRVGATDTSTSAASIDSFQPLPQLTSGTKISKKERIHQARINAQAYGARDALKLSNAANGAPAAAKRSPVTKPSQTAPSPWHVNQQRLERARANGKLFGERDKKRIQQAMMDSPWRRKQNTRSNALK